jgi:hypothetical protein
MRPLSLERFRQALSDFYGPGARDQPSHMERSESAPTAGTALRDVGDAAPAVGVAFGIVISTLL